MGDHKQIYFPMNYQELFSIWNSNPNAILYAGGTGHIRNQNKHILEAPQNIISLDGMEDLHRVSRTERYIELGAMVKLNQIINLGKIVPEPLIQCLGCIAGPQLRNQATIGGNICYPSRRLDACAPMIAMDAHYELKSAQTTRWIPASRFSSLPGPPPLNSQEFLTRIRVPLEPWDFTWYRKFLGRSSNRAGGAILFIMKNQKNILTNIRVVFTGRTILREKNSETMLIGKRLPLTRRDVDAFVDSWKQYLSVYGSVEFYVFSDKEEFSNPELTKSQILNFIKFMLTRISE